MTDLENSSDEPSRIEQINLRLNRLLGFAYAADKRRRELGLPTVHDNNPDVALSRDCE